MSPVSPIMTTPHTIPIWFICINLNFEQVGCLFLLNSPMDNSIGHILMKTKEAYPTVLRDVDNDQLKVWKINNPVRQPSKRYKTTSGSTSPSLSTTTIRAPTKPLRHYWAISAVPPTFLKKRVQAIVLYTSVPLKRAASAEPSGHLSRASRVEPIVVLEKTQKKVVQGALDAPSPSQGTVLTAFIKGQNNRPTWNGRPSTNRGFPIQLYHPSFERFLRVIRVDTVDIGLKTEDYSATHSLFHPSAALYRDEDARSQAIRIHLDTAIHGSMFTLHLPGMKASEEEKNEIGTGGCDPSHQYGIGYRLYYARENMQLIRHNFSFPAFLIALAGPWICILGAVFI
ncbi:hypothetical protein BJV74DRAFT_882609 [Russula compacta]|nr:hypothetical protein BJV74DRAFT_882609 [Russula compacta]